MNTPLNLTLRRLTAAAALGLLMSSTSAFAAPETGDNSRLARMIERLDPAKTGQQKLANRLVLASDGIGEQSIVIDENHSIAIGNLFETGGDRLTERGRQLLDTLGDALSSAELVEATYLIGGHTDAEGADEKNRERSERRANIVKTYLVRNFGIDQARLAVAGFGEERLADPENPDSEINRRIEVSLVTTGYTAKRRAGRQLVADSRYDDGRALQPLQAADGYAAAGSTGYQGALSGAGFVRSATADSDYGLAAPLVKVGYAGYMQQGEPLYNNSDLDDYGSVLALPPTTHRHYMGYTGNSVCDSAPSKLFDPRPLHMEEDDYNARTPTTCPTASGKLILGKGNNFFQDGDDDELLK